MEFKRACIEDRPENRDRLGAGFGRPARSLSRTERRVSMGQCSD
jgi:hypothetical protein